MTERVISYKQAKAEALKFYFTGLPCIRGHISIRYTKAARCKICANMDAAARVKERPEETKAYLKLWQKNNRARTKELTRRWVQANAARKRNSIKKWHEANPGKRRQFSKRWLDKNPGAEAMYARRHHARKRNAEGSHTIADIRRIITSQGSQCAYAKHQFEWCIPQFTEQNRPYMDHIIALARGGSDYPQNLQALCHACNERKWIKDETEFLRQNGVATS